MGSFSASLKTFGDSKGLPATVHLDEGRLSIAAGETDIGDWPLDEVSLEPVPNGYRLAAEGEQLFLEMADHEQFAEELSQASKRKLTLNGIQMPRLKEKRGKNKTAGDADHPARRPAAPARQTGPVDAPTNVKVVDEDLAPSAPPLEATLEPPKPAASPVEAKPPKLANEAVATEKKGRSALKFLVAKLDHTIDTSEKRWGSLLPAWVFNRIVFVQAGALLLLAVSFPGPASKVLLVAGLLAVMVGGAAYTDDVLASKLLPGRTTATHVLVLGVALLGLGLLAGFVSR